MPNLVTLGKINWPKRRQVIVSKANCNAKWSVKLYFYPQYCNANHLQNLTSHSSYTQLNKYPVAQALVISEMWAKQTAMRSEQLSMKQRKPWWVLMSEWLWLKRTKISSAQWAEIILVSSIWVHGSENQRRINKIYRTVCKCRKIGVNTREFNFQ